MLVLAVDTSTPAVTAGVVRVTDGQPHALSQRIVVDPRLHAEVLTPNIVQCLAEAALTPQDLQAVVVGVGPGPFTGLRVGMATASAFADALGIPIYGVCSLDAIAAELPDEPDLVVVTDARRREVYWARYRHAVRYAGPEVVAPALLDVAGASGAAGSPLHLALFEVPVREVVSPSPQGLVLAALEQLASSSAPAPIVPLYLRRPDAKTLEERAAAKTVTS
ncbi:tRNA (adenosine(37)-N6)-threonylcarbamoyltransferase complex dimerization subunit type 1 TsaB [Rhodococcus sp. H29-C3]|uniref:tRNA (adenosine(37)-N6)-threonylcarbamoyltransferase complex dimerization subunit type 1 TsaB n=1 Tax=Rhodococcus sp. H29-C3 TaxID=3046307 RepID=UPI0024B8FC79|nr:tRNA (adenosine(37)-N6)-threonylcarbamoyltransferase complex dimerization subunit type 1 TsaB [Rhodococcus sp. H29-C3]MDJ0361761.1 tRNA (adenosine(37)-N6)-threonylcarbamoyltransferase complex dimerization subunit type 1 TsaB [Rhodococcus sp. H29-C3]